MKILVIVALFACATAFRLPPAFKQVPRPADWRPQPKWEVDDDKIVGGVEATQNEFPFIVSLRRKPWWLGSTASHFCGGSIIGANKVLTAAHCTSGTSASDINVAAGQFDKSSDSDDNEQIRTALRKSEHSDYNSQTIDMDFAVLTMSSSFTLNTNVAKITMGGAQPGQMLTVSGWGTLSAGGSSPNNLQRVDVPAITNTECNAAYKGGITDNMLCAGYSAGGKDSCQGDSGGPLVRFDGTTPTLVGVVSWGNGCAEPGYPGVYARCSKEQSWIMSQ
ncbi:expressed hypothetical protein [Trichoplax adhaerens]|uniref:Peptidase S1 domain-containing protein n=1 Tax=Trichoplax adhaerens TaxID=10228 RepID=B3S1L4_TRIAD|nr:expressed hypothetical protein [Trichoplax adhaerens]EDV23250.1 expressed hypothetical protein [Trichoplax adhaerens]|eukprot:XP_002114160.1 expressed hypothetical protein [Trichoplax adhaerens]